MQSQGSTNIGSYILEDQDMARYSVMSTNLINKFSEYRIGKAIAVGLTPPGAM